MGIIGLIGWYFFGWKLSTFVVLVALHIVIDEIIVEVKSK